MSRRGKHNKGWKSMAFLAQPELPPLPVIPSQWEELLRALALDDEQALAHVEMRTETGRRLAAFARQHATRRYVPEPVLKALGLDEHVERTLASGRNLMELREGARRGGLATQARYRACEA